MVKKDLTIGLVQERWVDNPSIHQDNLAIGIRSAAQQGASLICLQELTLSPYFCTRPDVDPKPYMEDLEHGPTAKFVGHMSQSTQTTITASLCDSAGYNTAVAFGPQGQLVAATRKQHIPSGEKYHEDHYFKVGDSDYPIHNLVGCRVGLPTCYDQWFPELSRIYGLKNADILIYPTAIGDEPTAPDLDTQPMWQTVMIAQGIMANCFIVAVNRVGKEDGLKFYGSSFISSPLGQVLVQAPRHEPAVLVTTIELEQRALWGRLFPFAQQRQPQTYRALLSAIQEGES